MIRMKAYTKPEVTGTDDIERIVTFAAGALALKAVGALVGYAATRAVAKAMEIEGRQQGLKGLEQVLAYE